MSRFDWSDSMIKNSVVRFERSSIDNNGTLDVLDEIL